MALFLIDGHALAYRSYFALIRNPLTNSRGENTSAVYGFTRLILLLLRKYDPQHLAVVFDSGGETERHREYPEYKAHREAMPDDMESQLSRIVEVLEALGVEVVEEEGYEADDILATLARRAAERGMDVKILTGDKDLFQMLSERVHIILPGRGTALEDECGPEYLEERFGLRPAQIVDLLALMGDASDNIPGVKGIGEKTALKLLHAFGSLDEILERMDEVEPAHVRRKLQEGRESALFSRELVRLKDIQLDLDIDDLVPGERDEERLTDLLIDLEFHQMLNELSLDIDRKKKEEEYGIVGREGLASLAEELHSSKEFVIDVETTSLDPLEAEIVGISFSTGEGAAWFVPVSADESGKECGFLGELDDGGDPRCVALEEVRGRLDPVLADPSIGKIGHNIKYDLLVLESHGLRVEGVRFDTMIASYLLDPERRSQSLDSLAVDFCRHRMISYAELFEKGDRVRNIRTVPLERLARYSCEDADYTMRLVGRFRESLEEAELDSLFSDIEMPLCLVLKRMEREGISIDTEKLGALSREVSKEMKRLTRTIHEQAGEEFNINSGRQLQRILFDKLGLKPVRKTKTGYSTDMEVLSQLASEHEIAERILEYRQLAKLAGTYIDALPKLVNRETGRIHTSFNQAVTATGRLSSSDPNLQNIPIRTELGRKIRSAFIPRPGNVLLDADYSQIELRIMAHLSGDESLLDAFRAGADIHTSTAARIRGVTEEEVDGEMRGRAKTINFGVMYGMGARGLSRQLGISVEEAKSFIEEYFERYPGIREYIERSKEDVRGKGFAETLLGRRRMLPDIESEDGRVRSFSERIAINMPIQGTAADMIKVAMVGIDRAITDAGLRSRMILQVHDELVFDVVPDELDEMREIVRELMESAVELKVPVRVDIGVGGNWLEAHR
jgi:DNA polymerase-1